MCQFGLPAAREHRREPRWQVRSGKCPVGWDGPAREARATVVASQVRDRMRKAGRIAVVLLGMSTLFGAIQASAQEATPVVPTGAGETFTLVERALNVTIVEVGDAGPSAGDITVWGPNSLYDEANEVDTGAVTQGSCLALVPGSMNHCTETVVFPDGSTLAIQGVQRGPGETSVTTIVAGSGAYLGASGTVTVTSSEDGALWTKTFEIFFLHRGWGFGPASDAGNRAAR